MIKSVTVKNIRNLDIDNVEFAPGVNIIVGENGQGKTNLLEALFLLAYGKSFIADKSKVINWRSESGLVLGKTEAVSIAISLRKKRENKITVNGKQKSLGSILGKFLCVSFHPQDIELITGPPGRRRNWLDRLIATLDRTYLVNLVKYNKSIQSRNKLLRLRDSLDQLEVWNKVAAKLGISIWKKRRVIVDRVNAVLKREAVRITGKEAFLDYTLPLEVGRKDSEETYIKKLVSLREMDVKLSATTFGPHRDDFKVIFEERKEQRIIQKEVSFYGSRAEQRQSVLLLKLAETRLLTEESGDYPTVLLDDIASELDKVNRQFLTKPFAKQLIVTTTSLELLPKDLLKKARVFNMKEGRLQSLGASSV